MANIDMPKIGTRSRTPGTLPGLLGIKQQGESEGLMGILAECPVCRSKQAIKNKSCKKCSENLDKAKKSKRVKYWINYRFPGGKQKREYVGYSIQEARDALGKKMSQKRENKLFDIREDTTWTFKQLSEWYLNLESVKGLKAHGRKKTSLDHFNKLYGDMIIGEIKLTDLEDYQMKRKKEGMSDKTVDLEIGDIKTMVNKAFYNDMVSGETLKAFKRTKNLMKRNANARDRILSPDELRAICEEAPAHVRNAVLIGYHSGMRRGEILQLRWPMLDLKARTITLEAYMTKDNEKRIVPISDSLMETLKKIPRHIHDDHVLIFRQKPLDTLGKALKRACERAGVPYGRHTKNGFTFHDLRHTFNTNMRKAGVAESVIMAITGHSTREMFDRYNTVDLDDTRKAVDQLEVFFQSVDQNVDQTKISAQ